MPLTERQSDLLFSAIREYIRTGDPVASEDLRERYRLAMSPATIRNELVSLSEYGFLVQPHTSAGRVPSDTGYRWYVECLKATESLAREEAWALEALADHTKDSDDFFRAAGETFAHIVGALVVTGETSNKEEPFYKCGFREVLVHPEFTDPELRNSFGELVDSIDNGMNELLLRSNFSEPEVFIGKENPIKDVRQYSMMIRTLEKDKVHGVIAIIGPKRMQYDKGMSLLREIDQFFNQ